MCLYLYKLFLTTKKKTNLVKMNVTNAAILQYHDLSTPGPLEQEPGREQGLGQTWLNEYLYAG